MYNSCSDHPKPCPKCEAILMPPMDDRRTAWLQISTLYMVTFIDAQCRKASRELNHPQLLPLALMLTPQPSQELHETVSYKKLKVLRVTETFPLLWKVHSWGLTQSKFTKQSHMLDMDLHVGLLWIYQSTSIYVTSRCHHQSSFSCESFLTVSNKKKGSLKHQISRISGKGWK